MNWNFKVIENPSHEESLSILKMAQDSFGVKAESIYLFKILAEFGKICVTYDDEIPICVVQMIRNWEDINTVQIASFATHPKYQGKGIGTFTAREIIKYLASENISNVGIRIEPKNKAMLKIFQEKLNFSVIEILPNYYGPSEDRIYLEKKILKRL